MIAFYAIIVIFSEPEFMGKNKTQIQRKKKE
jgi:hypothetical protein